MEGRVSGSQPISVRWFRGGSEILSSDQYDVSFKSNVSVLCIKSSRVTDSGSYQCRASTRRGSPAATSPWGSKPQTVDEGEKLSLRCHVVGSPPLTISWMKDRKDLTSAGSTKITFSAGTASLEISPASRHDAGDYLCKASNDGGKKPGVPAPAEAPAAAAQKLDNLFFIEEPKTIHVTEMGGDPIPSVKWMKGKWRQVTHGGRISMEQKGQEARLEIREVTKSDSAHGEIESSADLQVDEKKGSAHLEGDLRAKLKKTPSKQKSPQEEKDIDIVDLLRNVDPKEYEKYARMYGITDYRGLLQAIEQLKKEKAEESGRPVKRMERTEPVTVMKDISDQCIFTQKEALFECEVKINYPEITLSWYKGTQKLDSGDKYDISISGDRHLLKVKNCQPADQGNYRVVCGPHISSARLAVAEAEVEKHLQETSGKEGQSCSLSCQLSIPNVEAQWFKNGKRLEMKGRYTGEEVKHKVQKLLIRDLKTQDQGRYSCRYQTLESSADLWVEAEQIHFTKRIHNIEVNERQSATFECEVSFDNAIVSWYKDTWELRESPKYNFTSEGRRHFMVIRNVATEDEGAVYSVIVRLEPRGEAKSTAELYLSGKEIELAMVPMDMLENNEWTFGETAMQHVPDSSVQRPDVPSSAAIQESAEYSYHYEEDVQVQQRVERESWSEETGTQQVSTATAARVAVQEKVETKQVGMREGTPSKVPKAEKKPETKPTASLKEPSPPTVPEAGKPVERRAAAVSEPEQKKARSPEEDTRRMLSVPLLFDSPVDCVFKCILKDAEAVRKPAAGPSPPAETPGLPKKVPKEAAQPEPAKAEPDPAVRKPEPEAPKARPQPGKPKPEGRKPEPELPVPKPEPAKVSKPEPAVKRPGPEVKVPTPEPKPAPKEPPKQVPVEGQRPVAPRAAAQPGAAPREEPAQTDKAVTPKPKVVPGEPSESAPQKVLEPERRPGGMPEPPGKAEGKGKTPERVPEKVLAPQRKVDEIPKKVPEKRPAEKAPPETKSVKVSQKVSEEERPPEDAKPEPASQRGPERLSVDRTPEQGSQRGPERLSVDRTPEQGSQRGPERVSVDRTPEQGSQRGPERLSVDRTPEQGSQRGPERVSVDRTPEQGSQRGPERLSVDRTPEQGSQRGPERLSVDRTPEQGSQRGPERLSVDRTPEQGSQRGPERVSVDRTPEQGSGTKGTAEADLASFIKHVFSVHESRRQQLTPRMHLYTQS
ncbi:hypothetical protein KUCAC02_035660 [Chaenocephalus aceratus]|nr:hypothetical protein KUCAC02_035660 [Chaenocephalus aceratus]